MASVQNNGLSLYDVKEQTHEICLAAVQNNGWALKSVKKQTYELCLEAVKQYGMAILFVKKQTYELCFKAVKQNGNLLATSPHLCLTIKKKLNEWLNSSNFKTKIQFLEMGRALKMVIENIELGFELGRL